MTTFLVFLLVGYIFIINTDSYDIYKNTMSTSDSDRDYYYLYNIFLDIDDDDEYDGMCDNEMNVKLHHNGFKIHALQSWQHDIDILEKQICEKWKDIMSPTSTNFNYDIFLDFNIAFYVNSLDPFISKWEIFNAQSIFTNHDEMEYFGIEWYYNLDDIDLEIKSKDYKNNKFYSVLIHSPGSNINYEFISYRKPSNKYYKNMKWINSNIPRTTFKGQNKPFPWNINDKTYIVPLRISRGTTNIDEIIDFYINVMEANILYSSNGIIIDDLGGDNIKTKTVIFNLLDTKIELQFYQRPSFYTSGHFTLKQYEKLLIKTHDPWFNNHYSLKISIIDGYLDEIINKLNIRNKQKYKIYETLYDKIKTYILFIFEPSGQCIQIMGNFQNTNFQQIIPNLHDQCMFVDDDKELHLFGIGSTGQQHHEKYILGTLTGLICGTIMCTIYYFYKKWKKQRLVGNIVDDTDKTPLIIKK